ncbi:MAG: GPP34 family phosphoprotein [Alphaproteobacteria bacterium]|nr:GPP34 family phosphoprotein [Alphaproteobacteria bacterium]
MKTKTGLLIMYGDTLYFYEEILLLALKDEAGVTSVAYIEQSIAGALLAELILAGRIALSEDKKKTVTVVKADPMGDAVIDSAFDMIKGDKKSRKLNDWVSRIAAISDLFHTAAGQLCARGILKADQDKILLFFTRRIYPEINPIPENKLIDRLRLAIFSDSREIDPRTTVLISLTQGIDLLRLTFGAKEVKARKARIEAIINGEIAGNAIREVIEACNMAAVMTVMVAVIIPTVVT